MKNLFINNKGITLITLVITIIILIILGGIALNVVFGENGLISKTQSGASKYQDESIKEKIQLAVISSMVNDVGKVNADMLRTQLNEQIGEGKYTLTIDETTGEITIVVGEIEYKVSANGTILGGDSESGLYDNIAKSTKFGKDTSGATWDNTKTSGAKLDLGESTNLRLKKVAALANGVSEDVVNTWTVYNSEDTYIKSIVWSSSEPTAEQKVNYGQLAMTSDSPLGMESDGTTNELIVSDVPIYAWFDKNTGTMYIWSKDETIDMHPHSERMFQGMKSLETIPALSHFVADDVKTMRYMFKDTEITNFSVCDNWDVGNVKTSLKVGKESLPENNGFYYICNNTVMSILNTHPMFKNIHGWWDEEGTLHIGFDEARYTTVGLVQNLCEIRGRKYKKKYDNSALAFLYWNNRWGATPFLVSPTRDGATCEPTSVNVLEGTYTMKDGTEKKYYYTANNYAMAFEGGNINNELPIVDSNLGIVDSELDLIAKAVIKSYGEDKFFNILSDWYYSKTVVEGGAFVKVTVSDCFNNNNGYRGIDNDESTGWGTDSANYGEHWLNIELLEPKCIKGYYIYGATCRSNGEQYKYYLQASNDGINWVNLEGNTIHEGEEGKSDTGAVTGIEKHNYTFNNTTTYKYYRLFFTQGGWTYYVSGGTAAQELQLKL